MEGEGTGSHRSARGHASAGTRHRAGGAGWRATVGAYRRLRFGDSRGANRVRRTFCGVSLGAPAPEIVILSLRRVSDLCLASAAARVKKDGDQRFFVPQNDERGRWRSFPYARIASERGAISIVSFKAFRASCAFLWPLLCVVNFLYEH